MRPLALLACLLLPFLRADETPPPTAVPSAYEQAAAQAAQENKPLLLIFTGAWEPDCATLEESLTNRSVRQQLENRIVVARIDVLTAPALTAKLHVRDVPLMILLKPDGTELDRWLGAQRASHFADELPQALNGHPSLERLRAEIKPSKTETRRTLADQLIARGSYADALVELRRLYEQLEYGTTKTELRANRNERRRVIALLGSIRDAHPPAGDFLRAKRTSHATDAAPPTNQSKYAQRIANIDTALDRPDDTLTYFRSLPVDSPAYGQLRSNAFLKLVENKGYAEATALYKPEIIAKNIEYASKLPWSLVHGIIRVRFPIKAGELIKLLHTAITAKYANDFEAYAGIQDKAGARLIAEMTLKHDRSEQAAPLLARAARRALGENADDFLRSLEIPGLPPPQITNALPEPIYAASEEDDDNPVMKLSPFHVTTRTYGIIPFEVSMPGIFISKKITGHLPVKTTSATSPEALAPYREGGWLVAINGKPIKNQEWSWLHDFWLEGGETGTPVTLILKGANHDDCIYREVTVKRVRPQSSEKK